MEVQIAYELYLGTRTDFENAAHPFALFRENVRRPRLESLVEKLDVADQYERLEST